MSTPDNFHHSWEVRPTLRLSHRLDEAEFADVMAVTRPIEEALRRHLDVSAASVWLESSHSEGVTASIVLKGASTPGAAADAATLLLAEACTAAGLATDIIKEVVVEMADVDPRSL